MSASACATCPADVVALNNALPAWAAGLTTAQSPITLADLWTGFDAVTDTVDGVHPNDTGFQKMSDRWYPALTQALGAAPPASPSASASPSRSASPSASPSAPAGGSCSATYKVVSSWSANFQGEVAVTNASSVASTGWTATFTFANGQQVSQAWNATVTQSGATVTARNASYNGGLSPGASTTFGYLATWNNVTNAVPAVTCTLS